MRLEIMYPILVNAAPHTLHQLVKDVVIEGISSLGMAIPLVSCNESNDVDYSKQSAWVW